MNYDFIIVGSGFFGSICAHELKKIGFNCLVLEKRDHIGGNCYTENRDGINLHIYGPHIFHTNDEEIWNWINKFANFKNYVYNPVANYKGEIFSLPFNMWTFSKLWKISHPNQAKDIIESQSKNLTDPKNLEEQSIKLVGKDVFEKLIKGYTEKQWKKPSDQLPIEIIKRLPVRFTYDNNYFNDKYQGIPIGGYTQIFEKLLMGTRVILNTDYLSNKEYWDNQAKKIIYTGPIDSYFNYVYGELEYKSTEFEHKKLNIDNFQGTSVMNYTDIETPYTRCIEHKHFEGTDSDCTWISYEYPVDYNKTKVPFYPVNDEKNNKIYLEYKKLAESKKNIMFGGRLAEYKYYDMHQVIDSALKFVNNMKFDMGSKL
jgi:UDP-galactopyranose mutase